MVEGVNISVTGKSPTDARNAAIASGRRDAFLILLTRLEIATKVADIVSNDEISDMVRSEQIDAEKASRVNKDVVSTAGYANDSLSYAMALDIAQTKAQLGGEDLSVEDFAERVQRDPGIVNKLLSEQKYLDNMSVTSGDPNRAKAYVTQPPTNTLGGTNVQKMQMSNQPGKSTVDFDYDGGDDDYAIADAIDLESEIGSDEKGSIRRV
jgi:hypothetical protein